MTQDTTRTTGLGPHTPTGLVLTALLAALAFVPTASAHSGTTHAQTPHWLLLVLTVGGLTAVFGTAWAVRRGRLGTRFGLAGIGLGTLAGGFGGVGLVEMQIVSTVAPQLLEWYPVFTLLAGTLVMTGSVVGGFLFWRTRPRYTALGIVLGAWILYPTLLPNEGTTNPLGYVVVLALPITIAYVLRQDAAGLVGDVFARRKTAAAGVFAAVFVVGFLSFSAGTLTVNPDWGPGGPTGQILAFLPVASPLVYWPAVEFVFPSVPLAGMLSVGTVLLFGTLATLVGINASVMATQWLASSGESSSTSMLGAVATTGATACCCCAPAMYGVLSAAFGAAASPLYWAFMDPSSPLGTLFLALSVTLLTVSIVRTAESWSTPAVCDVDRSPVAGQTSD